MDSIFKRLKLLCPKHLCSAISNFSAYRWQSTVQWQGTEGLWGALLVHGKREAYRSEYDEELTLTLTDWYHTTGSENNEWWQAGLVNSQPIPNSILINGKGTYPCHLTKLPCKSNQSTPSIRVKRGKRYRIRVINTSSGSIFFLSILGYKLAVIETDGVDTVRADLDRVALSEGQRVSVIVELNGKRDAEWVIIQPSLNFFKPEKHNVNKNPENYVKGVGRIKLVYFGSTGSAGSGSTVGAGSDKRIGSNESTDVKSKAYPPISKEALYFKDQDRLRPLDGVLAPNYFDVEIIVAVKQSKFYFRILLRCLRG
jgi:hypothetical protein